MLTDEGHRVLEVLAGGWLLTSEVRSVREHYGVRDESPTMTRAADVLPDPEDRVTYLALCDEAERRGVDTVTEHLDGGIRVPLSLDTVRALWAWERDPADGGTMIAALARALRAAAPTTKEPDHG